MSRQSRPALLARLGEEIRGWQLDQDLFDEAMALAVGLNRTDTRCLDVVTHDGPITAGALASAVRLTTGAVTAVLDRLEAAGYVRRVRDAADRRRVLVEATPKLAEAMAPLLGPLLADGEAELRKFKDAEIALIIEFLESNRRLLAKHTNRIHEEILGRKERHVDEAQPVA